MMKNSTKQNLFSFLIKEETDTERKISLIARMAQQCRTETFEMIHRRGNGHWGGSSSCAEILSVLYSCILKVKPEEPGWSDRDRLILSKGHAAPILYNILAHCGFFPLEELLSFRTLNSRLQGHPCLLQTPGIDLSTGPLGHGISVGLGMALAARLLKKKYWTFVIVGEGCLNEGQSWEGLMAAAKFKPARFVLLVDYNKIQLDGPSNEIMPLEPLADKFRAFKLQIAPKMYDGHDIREILNSWDWMQKHQEMPCVVIYNTHKGKGISFTEDNHKWHGCPIDDISFDMGKMELDGKLNNESYGD